MAHSIELTAEQLAGLDQIIAQKQRAEEFITDAFNAVAGAANIAARVVPVVAAVTQAVAGAALTADTLAKSSLKDLVKNVPVEKLIEIRKNAVQKG